MVERWYDPALPTGNGIPTGRAFPVDSGGQAPPEFGRRPPRFGIITLPLDVARFAEQTEIGGTVLWAIDASDVDARIEVSFQEEFAPQVPFKGGQLIAGHPFSRCWITNTVQLDSAGNAKTITLLYTTEDFPQFRIANSFALGQQVTIINPSTTPVAVLEQLGARTLAGTEGIHSGIATGTLVTHRPQIQIRALTNDCFINAWQVSVTTPQILAVVNNIGAIVGGFTAFPNKDPGQANLNAQLGTGTGAVPTGNVIARWYAEPGHVYDVLKYSPIISQVSPIRQPTLYGGTGIYSLLSTVEITEPAA